MSKFHPLKVKEIIRETPEAVSLGFDVPSELKQEYKYKQGQYLTLRFMIDGEEIRRSYSICSSPFEKDKLEVAIKKVKGGKVSNYINDVLKPGDTVDVMVPMGGFHSELHESHTKHYVLFAGGSGITPMMSIMKAVLTAEPHSRITLLYGNNDEASVIFKKQIEELAVRSGGKLKVVHILNLPPNNYPELLQGMMTKEKNLELIKEFIDLGSDNEYFICGPTPMMDGVVAALKESKADESRIHIEYFSTPATAPTPQSAPSMPIVKDAHLTIIMDGDEYQTTMLADEPVLFAAKRIGLDAPYSCQNGSCSTCRAKLLEGKVYMKVNFALTPKDVASGFILTCQSLPLTESLVVSYDQAV
ncbi:MAG: FAD-binding oxidoreductase [Candidatus Kapaibacterium sp.]